MSWKGRFFKPDWESTNADKRLASIRDSQESGMFQALPEIIRADPDYRVRLAALKRLLATKTRDPQRRFDFLLKTYQLLIAESNGTNSDTACQNLRETLSGQLQASLKSLPLDRAEASNIIEQLLPELDIETLAVKAKSAAVRYTAIAKISTSGLLGDIAIRETEPELRRLAVARIERLSTLERVATALRTRDKKLYHQIRERLRNARPDEHSQHQAVAICSQLETMLKDAAAGVHPQPQGLVDAWQQLRPPPEPALQQRYHNLLGTLEKAAEGVPAQPLETAENPATTETRQKNPPAAEKTDTKAEPEPPAKSKPESRPKAGQRLAEQRVRVKKLLATIEAAQNQLAEEIEAANLKATVRSLRKIRGDLQTLRKTRQAAEQLRELEGRQSRLHGRVKQLRDYQHWANNQIRSELITRLQAMPADSHPDAILSQLHEARQRWRELEAGEQLPGDRFFHAPASLWRQFRKTCDLAEQVVQPYLQKRKQQQLSHLEKHRQLIRTGTEFLASRELSARDLIRQQRQLRQALRDLNHLPGKHRGKLARQSREQLDRLQTEIVRAFEIIATEKSRILRQAEQLKHIDDRQQAIQQAKQLQREWQAAGSGARKQEQALWKKFRACVDPLFAGQAEEQARVRAAKNEQIQSLRQLCEQLEALLKLPPEALSEQKSRGQQLESEWQTLTATIHPGALEKRFKDGLLKFHEMSARARYAQRQLLRQQWQQHEQLLVQLRAGLDAGETLNSNVIQNIINQWQLSDNKDTNSLSLESSFRNILASKVTSCELDDARKICLQLEYLAGLESPPGEKQLRMDMQIQRLAENMSGASERLPLKTEVRQLETAWYRLPVSFSGQLPEYRKRFHRAITELSQQIEGL